MVRGTDKKISASYGNLVMNGQMMFMKPETTNGDFILIESKITDVTHVPFMVDSPVVETV